MFSPEDSKRGNQLLLEEARRRIDQQVRDLTDLRSRAGQLLGFSGIAATFFGAFATPREGVEPLQGLVVVAFIAVAAASGFVLSPRRLTFNLGYGVLHQYLDQADDADHMTAEVARWHDQHYLDNRPTLRRMHAAYFVGVIGLGLEIALLLLDAFNR